MTVVVGFQRCRGGVVGSGGDLTVETPVVEPVDVRECGELNVLDPDPRSLPVDYFPLVESVEQSRPVGVPAARQERQLALGDPSQIRVSDTGIGGVRKVESGAGDVHPIARG